MLSILRGWQVKIDATILWRNKEQPWYFSVGMFLCEVHGDGLRKVARYASGQMLKRWLLVEAFLIAALPTALQLYVQYSYTYASFPRKLLPLAFPGHQFYGSSSPLPRRSMLGNEQRWRTTCTKLCSVQRKKTKPRCRSGGMASQRAKQLHVTTTVAVPAVMLSPAPLCGNHAALKCESNGSVLLLLQPYFCLPLPIFPRIFMLFPSLEKHRTHNCYLRPAEDTIPISNPLQGQHTPQSKQFRHPTTPP
jgi:hypothetical protein